MRSTLSRRRFRGLVGPGREDLYGLVLMAQDPGGESDFKMVFNCFSSSVHPFSYNADATTGNQSLVAGQV